MSSEGNITVIESFRQMIRMHLGLRLDSRQSPGMCTLVGDLELGKTVLTQGIAEGLGITEPINSPTFTIVQVYRDGQAAVLSFRCIQDW